MRPLRIILLIVLASPAGAITITGANYNGGNLIPNNFDILSGTFTNVGLFQIQAGNTVSVAAQAALVVYASTVAVYGSLDAAGSGEPGGSGGTFPSGAGDQGIDGGGSNAGQGLGGAGAKGGGGGAGGGTGGIGAGVGGGSGGAAYGSPGTVTGTISSGEIFPGSGGGGGGANTTLSGGNGGAGGGAIYIEAASMTVTGSISVSGSTAPATPNGSAGTNPGGGGGGAGGTLILRITNALDISAAQRISADGGRGGDVDTSFGGTLDPGGGGGGGRIKLFYQSTSLGSVTLSTAAGPAGLHGTGFLGNADAAGMPGLGSSGTITFGVIASSATNFAAESVYVTSIDWNWTATSSFGDAPAGTDLYRIFPSSVTLVPAPYPAPQKTSLTPGVTEQGLVPNTTYYRSVTAFTSWGDSLPSNIVSTHTLASTPAPDSPAFTGTADTTLTLHWTAGAEGNPAYTLYEIDASTSSLFAAPTSTSFAVALSSTPTNLSPNTTYYFRSRAINIDGVPTSYSTTMTTATYASTPTHALPGTVYVTSVAFSWSGGANPPGTNYVAQISIPGSVLASSATLGNSATFFNLTPGTAYTLSVSAVNIEGTPSASASTTTVLGNLSNVTPPTTPGTPIPDRQFSYDGTLNFVWAPASNPVGILDYNLLVGSLPGASDFFDGNVTVTSFSAAGLTTGHTYYAQVRARSNAGVYGNFSNASAGVSVFITSQVSALSTPINWPNPFNPALGPTQIGFFVDSPGTVDLKIFTLQGQLVHETSQNYSSTGNQIMTWNGSNDSGMRVAPGGYVALIEKHLNSGVSSQKFKIAVLY